jgi:hypothetical protein
MLNIDRMITTEMSANIVADLLKARLSLEDIARTIHTPVDFVRRVQKRLHTFTSKDLNALAKLSGQTPPLLLFNSMRPVRPEVKELFDATRDLLEKSASVGPHIQRKNGKKRRAGTKAA